MRVTTVASTPLSSALTFPESLRRSIFIAEIKSSSANWLAAGSFRVGKASRGVFYVDFDARLRRATRYRLREQRSLREAPVPRALDQARSFCHHACCASSPTGTPEGSRGGE